MSTPNAQQVPLPVPRPRGTSKRWMGNNTMLSSFVDVAIQKRDAKKKKRADAKKKKRADEKKMMKAKAEKLTQTVKNNLYSVLDSL